MTSQLARQFGKPIWDVFVTSSWHVNKTDTNLSETDQLSTLQRRFNWYLYETDVFETP